MGSLSKEQKAEFLLETRDAAIAFVEDMEYIRDTLARHRTSRGELRRLSAVLRRLLVEHDIAKIAVPRFNGRMTFCAPDRKQFYEAEKHVACLFFASYGATIFGIRFSAIAMWSGGNRPIPKKIEEIIPNFAYANKIVSLRLDNFLSQLVLCYRGSWVSRRGAIKHIANFGSGVHSTTPRTADDQLIQTLRNCCIFGTRNGEVELHVMPELGKDSFKTTLRPGPEAGPIDFEASDLDAVLVEILSAAQFLATSPDVIELERIVWAELDSLRPSPNTQPPP